MASCTALLGAIASHRVVLSCRLLGRGAYEVDLSGGVGVRKLEFFGVLRLK